MRFICFNSYILVFVLTLIGRSPLPAGEPPRVLAAGRLPDDSRLGPQRGERGDFNFKPPETVKAWQRRREEIRRTLRVASGLWPLPTKTPLNAVIHGSRDQGGYTVEHVYFESLPGFFVTGNLYRPNGEGPHPAVLSPHGHFPGGRFIDSGAEEVHRQIANGGERFEDGGRSFMQSRCVQLARLGCVVFHYDMVGYGDCLQIRPEIAHRFSRDRVKHEQPPKRGMYSAEAELWLHNMLGLHTYNSIRALDFLEGLPDVDAKRIAVTGGSGGGTQTFMLCAVDDRSQVSVPVVIVSADRQGGCTCENVSHLRIGANNLDFTALHASKPLLLVSADDATRTMPKRGFPELRKLYDTLGKPQNLGHEALLQFPHNYNAVSRAAMYRFVNRHLQLRRKDADLQEKPFQRLTREQLTVWNSVHPRPKGGAEFERRLLAWLRNDTKKQIEALTPRDKASLKQFRDVVGGG